MSKTIKQVIVLLPRDILETTCEHNIKDSIFFIPEIILSLINNTYHCQVDRKCPCECSNKIQKFLLYKQDFPDWLRNNNHWKIYKIFNCDDE